MNSFWQGEPLLTRKLGFFQTLVRNTTENGRVESILLWYKEPLIRDIPRPTPNRCSLYILNSPSFCLILAGSTRLRSYPTVSRRPSGTDVPTVGLTVEKVEGSLAEEVEEIKNRCVHVEAPFLTIQEDVCGYGSPTHHHSVSASEAYRKRDGGEV